MADPLHLPEILQTLAQIAQKDGEPHLLDTAPEIGEARRLLRTNLESSPKGSCEANRLKDALRRFSSGNGRWQVHPIFNDSREYLCPSISLWDSLVEKRIPLLERVEEGAYLLFHVYQEGVWHERWTRVAVTRQEWGWITEPLEGLDGETAETVRDALALAGSNFEHIVGPKAGTDRDLGGPAGNDRLHYVTGGEKGQQDCVNEARTTRQLIAVLAVHGLLPGHRFDPDDSLEKMDSPGIGYHVGVRIFATVGEIFPWVVDSWPGDNGSLPDILPDDQWRMKWRNLFPPF